MLFDLPASSGFTEFLTWLGTLRNGAVPDLVAKFRSVVVHVNHVDEDINGVLNLVAVHVHRMSSQLEKKTNIVCRFKTARETLQ